MFSCQILFLNVGEVFQQEASRGFQASAFFLNLPSWNKLLNIIIELYNYITKFIFGDKYLFYHNLSWTKNAIILFD